MKIVALEELLGPTVVSALRGMVREELQREAAAPAGDWLPHPTWPFGSRRRNAQLARSGRIADVRREGKVWLARRSAIDAFVATLPTAPATGIANDTAGPVDELDAEIEDLVRKRARR